MAWAQFSKDPQWASEDEKAAYFRDRTRATRKGELIEQAREYGSDRGDDPGGSGGVLRAWCDRRGIRQRGRAGQDTSTGLTAGSSSQMIAVFTKSGISEPSRRPRKNFRFSIEKFSEWDGGD